MMNEDVLNKIRKLLALSKSSNAHEASLAAARAADLMLKYQISEASVSGSEEQPEEEPGVHQFDTTGKKNRTLWRGTLAGGIARAFGSKIYWEGVSIKFVGRPSDLQACLYLYQLLVKEVDRLAEDGWEGEGVESGHNARSWKSAFRQGCAQTIRDRLVEQRKSTMSAVQAESPTQSTSNALMIVNRREMVTNNFYESISRGFGKVRGNVRNFSGYEAGREAGRGVNLNFGRGKAIGGSKPRLNQ